MNQNKLKDIITISVIVSMIIMESIDMDVLNVAVSTMAKSFMVSPVHLKLAITSYLLGIAIFIPISGWLSDIFGTKNTLMTAIIIFCLTSFLCGISKDLYTLSIFRFFQGISGAFMVPVARLLLLKAFNKEKLVKVYSIISMPTLIGPLIAPLIGGFFVTHFGWQYIFFINIPIGLIALIATYFYVDNYLQQSKIFDITTYTFLIVAITSIVFFANIALYDDFTLSFKLGLVALFIFAIVLYNYFEKRTKLHVINRSLFRIKTYRISVIASFIARLAFGGRGFLLALFLQEALFISPEKAGYLLSFSAVGLLFTRTLTKKLLSILGFRKLLLIYNLGSVISLLLIPLIHHFDIFAIIILIINGIFYSAELLVLNTFCYANISNHNSSDAVSLNLTLQQIARVFGVLLVGYCVKLFNYIFISEFGHMTFTFSFIILALIAFSSMYYFLQLKEKDGSNLLV